MLVIKENWLSGAAGAAWSWLSYWTVKRTPRFSKSLLTHTDTSDSDGNYGCGTAHLIFAYAISRFSHDAAHVIFSVA